MGDWIGIFGCFYSQLIINFWRTVLSLINNDNNNDDDDSIDDDNDDVINAVYDDSDYDYIANFKRKKKH